MNDVNPKAPEIYKDIVLNTKDLATRWKVSPRHIQMACKDDPSSVPDFFTIGQGSRLVYRFRLEDVRRFEESRIVRSKKSLKVDLTAGTTQDKPAGGSDE